MLNLFFSSYLAGLQLYVEDLCEYGQDFATRLKTIEGINSTRVKHSLNLPPAQSKVCSRWSDSRAVMCYTSLNLMCTIGQCPSFITLMFLIVGGVVGGGLDGTIFLNLWG